MTFLGVPNPPLPGAARKRPNNGLPFTHSASNERRSTCKLCPEGVFTGDDAVWIRGGLIGLAHRPCAVKAGATIVDQPRPAMSAPSARPAMTQTRGAFLTERQVTVVQLLADGHTPPEIAEIEQVTYQTVNNIIARARLRIDVADNEALIAAARKHGYVRNPGPKG